MTATANEPPVSRRRILGRLSLAAVGGGAMAATGIVGGGRASAADGDNLQVGQPNVGSSTTELTTTDSGGFASYVWDNVALYGDSDYVGVWGVSNSLGGDTVHGEHVAVWGQASNTCAHDKVGVRGEAVDGGGTGVEGISIPYGYGVRGFTGSGFGVRGEASGNGGIGVSGTALGDGVKGEGATGVRGVGTPGGTGVRGHVSGGGWGVWGSSATGHGVHGEGDSGAVGVYGRAVPYGYGVRGVSAVGFGIHGEATDGGTGVQGISDTSFGVRGDSTGGTGVRGESQTATGVYGRSIAHTGVTGYGGVFGVVGQCDGGGTAVDATSSDGGVGVWGRSLPTGYGVRGESSSGYGMLGEAVTGIGVAGAAPQGIAVSGKGRVGGEFTGSRAAVRLVPTGFVGAPTTGGHARGDLLCDKNGNLWFCKTGGTPGTWVKIA